MVDTIRAVGGTAVVNGDNVAGPDGAQRMVVAAMDAYGRLDAVVNNAGILRDGIFHKMSHADFEAVLDIHLRGSFNTIRAAALFREQGSGALVHFIFTKGQIFCMRGNEVFLMSQPRPIRQFTATAAGR